MGGRTKAKINPLHFVLFISIFVMSVFYVFTVNSMSGDNFELEALGKKIDELYERSTALEIRASQAQSLSALKVSGGELGLQKTTKVRYIQAKSSEPLVLGN